MRITSKLIILGGLSALIVSSAQAADGLTLYKVQAPQATSQVATLLDATIQSPIAVQKITSRRQNTLTQSKIAADAAQRAHTAESFRREQRAMHIEASFSAPVADEMPSQGTLRRERLFARSQNWLPEHCAVLHTHERARCLKDFAKKQSNTTQAVTLK